MLLEWDLMKTLWGCDTSRDSVCIVHKNLRLFWKGLCSTWWGLRLSSLVSGLRWSLTLLIWLRLGKLCLNKCTCWATRVSRKPFLSRKNLLRICTEVRHSLMHVWLVVSISLSFLFWPSWVWSFPAACCKIWMLTVALIGCCRPVLM